MFFFLTNPSLTLIEKKAEKLLLSGSKRSKSQNLFPHVCLQTLSKCKLFFKMSFKNYKDKIEEGDTVILYLSNNLYALDVQRMIKNKKGEMVENVFQTPFGALKVKNLIGADYGSRVCFPVIQY